MSTTTGVRVDLVTEERAPITMRPLYRGGDPGPIVRALAQVPEVAEVTLPFVSTVLGPTSLGLRTKEIVILRTSARLTCNYCTTTHAVAALDSGLDWPVVDALRRGVPPDELALGDADAALVRWVDAVAGGTDEPDDETYTQVRAHWSEAAVIELTLLVGATLMLNRFATSLGFPPSATTTTRLAAAEAGA